MKICLLFLFAFTFQLMALNSNAQDAVIELKTSSVTIGQLISEIEKQTDYLVVYSNREVDTNRKVNFQQNSGRVSSYLNTAFSNTDIGYNFENDYIVLSKKAHQNTVDITRLIEAVQQQGKTIRGKVTDENGDPVIGATIVEKNNPLHGTVTDVDGNFTMTNIPENAILQFTYVGMKTQEVAIDGRTTINIIMEPDVELLDEVVVVGYGTQRKGNITSAISTIKGTDIVTTTNANLSQSLQGKVPGLQIRQQTGEPGSFNSSINIRGLGEPLYVIDGIVRDGSSEFQQLNPYDIESISILKDASAAIYGLNAANGVILVTTKKGEKGKPKFSYNSVIGWQNPTDVPKMANAVQYWETYNDAIMYRDGVPAISREDLDKWRQGGPGYESTDWYAETMKSSAMQHQHDFSIRGGSEAVDYFVSFGYFNEEGLFKSNDLNYNRYTLRSNLTAKLNDYLTADVMLSGRYSLREFPGNDFLWIYKAIFESLPTEQPFINGDENYPADTSKGSNSVVQSHKKYNGFADRKNKNFQSSASLTYDAPFLPGLQAKGTFSFDSNFWSDKQLLKSYYVYNQNLERQKKNQPTIENSITDANRIVIQTQLNYNQTFNNEHTVGATLVYEQKNYNSRYSYLRREYGDFYTNDMVDNASGLQFNGGNEDEQANMSFLGRFNYNFRGKYMAEFTFRRDGSYRYTPEKRWGLFPAAFLAWRISEENFVKENLSFIDNLKLRASTGTVGQDVGAPYQHVMGFTPNTNQGYEFTSGVYTGGLSAPGTVNLNYTWVKSKISDIGLEIGIFNNRLNIEMDYYQRDLTGKIKRRSGSLPNTFGGNVPEENLESDRTQGLDFMVTHQNKINDLGYTLSFNMNLSRTMNRYLDESDPQSSYARWRWSGTNRWNDIEWVYDKIGQYQNFEEIAHGPIQVGGYGNTQLLPGDYIYKDVNGDGVIDGKDMQPLLRNRVPKLFYGFTLGANWKNFDLTMLLQGAGLYTMRFDEVFSQMFFGRGNIPAYFHDRWHRADPYDPDSEWIAGQWPANRFYDNMQFAYQESQAWRRNASYIRLKNIEFGYTIPSPVAKKCYLETARIYFNAHNLFTIAADPFLKQFDPEKYEGEYNAGYTYPITRSFNVGLNISF